MHIRKLSLETKEPALMQEFYSRVMQLPVTAKREAIEIRLGNTLLEFHQSESHDEPYYHFAIDIPCNKIEEAKAWMEARVELLWMEDHASVIADFKNWKAKSIYFFDPSGNIVEIIARCGHDGSTPESFSPEQFIAISEIGLVFSENEIEKETFRLMENYGIPFFSRQPPFPNFKALGTDSGLFIIVTENRNWYPTGKASKKFPLNVWFETDGKSYQEAF